MEEDPGSLNYLTTYDYDVLDNLTQVNQGSQQRTFAYDGLSRLTSANNVEQTGSTTFSYDKNGNLTSKTDPRSVTTTITYDDLNRPDQKSYSNGTDPVRFCYDGQLYAGTCFGSPVTGKKGRLTSQFGDSHRIGISVTTTELAFDDAP